MGGNARGASYITQQGAHQLVRQAKLRASKIRPTAVGGGIVVRFANFDKFPADVAGDITSSAAVDYVS